MILGQPKTVTVESFVREACKLIGDAPEMQQFARASYYRGKSVGWVAKQVRVIIHKDA